MLGAGVRRRPCWPTAARAQLAATSPRPKKPGRSGSDLQRQPMGARPRHARNAPLPYRSIPVAVETPVLTGRPARSSAAMEQPRPFRPRLVNIAFHVVVHHEARPAACWPTHPVKTSAACLQPARPPMSSRAWRLCLQASSSASAAGSALAVRSAWAGCICCHVVFADDADDAEAEAQYERQNFPACRA